MVGEMSEQKERNKLLGGGKTISFVDLFDLIDEEVEGIKKQKEWWRQEKNTAPGVNTEEFEAGKEDLYRYLQGGIEQLLVLKSILITRALNGRI